MKRYLLTPILLLPICAHADLVELWAPGVSSQSGWSDFNKTEENTNDDNLCWAASAANIINWWQQKYKIPTGTPTGDQVWTTFKDSFSDIKADPYNAYTWWLNGEYPNTSNLTDFGKTAGGYYKEYFNSSYAVSNALTGFYNSSYWGISNGIKTYLSQGMGLTISITDTKGETGHALTLWGAEYNTETLALTKLFLTDSDDNKTSLFEVSCTLLGEKSDTQYLGIENAWFDLGDRDYYVTSFCGLVHPSGFLQPIPEPSTFGLLSGVYALVFAFSRRRKHAS